MIAFCDASCLKALSKMAVPEFVTMVVFYCDNQDVLVSNALMMALFSKVQDSCPEFNEL